MDKDWLRPAEMVSKRRGQYSTLDRKNTLIVTRGYVLSNT